MRGAVTVFQAVLIFAIAVSMIALGVPWFFDTYDKSRDIGEIQRVKNQLEQCNEKLVETARTGTANTCIFSTEKGEITAELDGIYYSITTRADVCDDHGWVEINPEKHIWQKCEIEITTRKYDLKWSWPKNITIEGYQLEGEIDREEKKIADIIFDSPVTFRTLTVLVEFESIPGQAGRIIEINRKSIEEEKVILRVNIK